MCIRDRGNHVQAKKQYDTWTEEDEAGYQIYLQEQDMEKRTSRAWYLIANPRKLPKEIVNQELAFRFLSLRHIYQEEGDKFCRK